MGGDNLFQVLIYERKEALHWRSWACLLAFFFFLPSLLPCFIAFLPSFLLSFLFLREIYSSMPQEGGQWRVRHHQQRAEQNEGWNRATRARMMGTGRTCRSECHCRLWWENPLLSLAKMLVSPHSWRHMLCPAKHGGNGGDSPVWLPHSLRWEGGSFVSTPRHSPCATSSTWPAVCEQAAVNDPWNLFPGLSVTLTVQQLAALCTSLREYLKDQTWLLPSCTVYLPLIVRPGTPSIHTGDVEYLYLLLPCCPSSCRSTEA